MPYVSSRSATAWPPYAILAPPRAKTQWPFQSRHHSSQPFPETGPALPAPWRLSLPKAIAGPPSPAAGYRAAGSPDAEASDATLLIKGSGEASWVAALLPLPGSALKPSPRELLCRPHPSRGRLSLKRQGQIPGGRCTLRTPT